MTARIKDWTTACSHVLPNGNPCRVPAVVYEDEKPWCQLHTAVKRAAFLVRAAKVAEKKAAIASRAGAKAAVKARKAKRIADEREKAKLKREEDARKFFEEVEKTAEKERFSGKASDLFIGISGRKRAFDLCRRCNRSTQSGQPEEMPALRYCHEHMPLNVAIRQAELAAGRAVSATCHYNGYRFKGCYVPKSWLRAYAKVTSLGIVCSNTTTRCFDESRRWEVIRIRCRTKFPKSPGLAPAARPEDRAASP